MGDSKVATTETITPAWLMNSHGYTDGIFTYVNHPHYT